MFFTSYKKFASIKKSVQIWNFDELLFKNSNEFSYDIL